MPSSIGLGDAATPGTGPALDLEPPAGGNPGQRSSGPGPDILWSAPGTGEMPTSIGFGGTGNAWNGPALDLGPSLLATHDYNGQPLDREVFL